DHPIEELASAVRRVRGEPFGLAKLDALVSVRGPGRARIHRRDHLCRLAVCISAFIIEGGKKLCDGARLALGRRPVNLVGSLAMIPAGIGLADACLDRKALAPDKAYVHTGTDHRLKHLA